jgi:anti-sigma factor RsiW
MTTHSRHFKEEIEELVDNRLTSAARIEVEKHLESCEECHGEFEALRWAKQLSRKEHVVKSVPAKLEENILAALDLEDRRSGRNAGFSLKRWPTQKRILAYALLLFIVLVLVLSYFIIRKPLRESPELTSKPELPTKPKPPSTPNRPTEPELATKPELPSEPELSPKTQLPAKPKISRPDLPSEVASDYQNYKAGKVPLMLKTENVKEMEKFFSEEGIPYQTRVFDLGMMNYRLMGGRVHKLTTRKSAFFVYRGKGDAILVCQMYRGKVTELPAADAVLRENKGIQFYIYRVNGLTLTFWQEGPITCVLTSEIDPEQLIQLAFAKAVKT